MHADPGAASSPSPHCGAALPGRLTPPGPGFSRQLNFVTRREEFVTLGARVAELARNIVRARALPRFLKFAPWLEPKMEWMMLGAEPG